MHFRLHITCAEGVILPLLFAAIAVPLPASTQSVSLHRGTVQTHFTAEDEGVMHPVSIPSEVMKTLGDDEMVKKEMENEEPRRTDLPQSWFSASRIQLGPRKADGLIVQATGPLVGANVVVFWIFIQSQEGWKLALLIPAHDLIVMRTHFNGYRNLEVDALTCCTITTARFRFDGHEYKRNFSKTEDIK